MKKNDLRFRKIKGLFEPSGVVQASDGTVLAVDDELSDALVLLRCGKRKLKSSALALWPDHVGRVDDLEAITADQRGYCYAITSHSLTRKGRRKSTREKLLRFKLQNNCLTDVVVKSHLLEPLSGVLSKVDDRLNAGTRSIDIPTGKLHSIDIEGLAFNPTSHILYIGLCNPVIDGHALIIAILNPDAYFNGAKCELAAIPMYLDGGGIRSIAYDTTLDGCLIVAGRKKKRKKAFTLWLWKPHTDQAPQEIKLNSMKSLRQTEGIAEVRSNDRSKLLLLSDEGSAEKGRPARYLLLKHKHLLSD